MISRAQRTPFGEWWWTVDRLTLAAIGALMLAGVVLSLAATPPVAGRLGLEPFYFVNRHILFLIPTIAIMLAVSFLNPRQIRRLALIVFALSLIMVAATPYFGAEIKGARRWLILFGVNIQPSEFLKPAFVILVAWLFGESAKRPDMPANTIALLLLLAVVALLVMQPDFGQTMLVVLVWSALFFMAGMRLIWVFGIAGVAGFGLLIAYFDGAACGAPHPALPRSGLGRHLQHRHRHRKLHARRLVRPRSGRGHGQAAAAGEPHRFRVRGGGGGIRHRALPGAGGAVCLHRHPRADPRHAQRRSVHALCRRRPHHAVRHAVGDQHGGQSASDPGQGHDAAVHLLWRLVDALAGLRHGHAAGADPRTAARGHAGVAAKPMPAAEGGLRCARRSAARLLAAGGTGGHLFPAEALARRASRSAASPSISPPISARRAFRVSRPRRASHSERHGARPRSARRWRARPRCWRSAPLKACGSIGRIRPAVVVGFGGYPTVPPLWAASLRGVPTVLHEQNGVMGRANRLLAPRVTAIATSFRTLAKLDARLQGKISFTGNPVRPQVIEAAQRALCRAATASCACWCSAAARARA